MHPSLRPGTTKTGHFMFDIKNEEKIEDNIAIAETVFVPPEKAFKGKRPLAFDSQKKCTIYEDTHLVDTQRVIYLACNSISLGVLSKLIGAIAAKTILWSLFWLPFTISLGRMTYISLCISNRQVINLQLK